MIEGQVYDQFGRVDIIELHGKGLEPFKPHYKSTGITYLNYQDLRCGTCDNILYHIKRVNSDTIQTTLRWCAHCHILLELHFEVFRLRLQ